MPVKYKPVYAYFLGCSIEWYHSPSGLESYQAMLPRLMAAVALPNLICNLQIYQVLFNVSEINFPHAWCSNSLLFHWYDVTCGRHDVSYRRKLDCSLLWRDNGGEYVSNHQPHDCLLNRSSRRRSKKTSKLLVACLCVGNSPETGEFPAQMASNAENASILMTSSCYSTPLLTWFNFNPIMDK